MPPIESLAAFTALSFALIVVPGPSVLFVVSRAVALGRRAALSTVVGNSLGVFVQVVLVAVGLGAVVERSSAIFTSLKLLGAGYLVWLGIQAIRHRDSSAATALTAGGGGTPKRSVLLEGFVVGFTNPKAIVFFVAVLPQFVQPGGAPTLLQMVLLGLVFVLVALVSDSAWGLAAGTARDWFARSPRRLRQLRTGGGLAMVGLGVQLAFVGRKD